MSESRLVKLIQTFFSKVGGRLFRNNTGAFRDKRGNYVKFGLVNGGSDLIGFFPLTVTRSMVGRKFAIFVACEVKSRKGKPTTAQLRFIDMVKQNGGGADVVRSLHDAAKILHGLYLG